MRPEIIYKPLSTPFLDAEFFNLLEEIEKAWDFEKKDGAIEKRKHYEQIEKLIFQLGFFAGMKYANNTKGEIK